ncbi:MAG: response regulator transcription factor [Micrococcaceae bacterium]
MDLTSTARIRVLVVDDETLMRAGIRLMIDGVQGIEVVGEAADGIDAVAAVRDLAPDVVLMDIRMPRMNGIEATRELTRKAARARIVVLTAFDTDDFLLDALRGGAVSFLLKDSAPERVVQAVTEAAAGHPQVSTSALATLVELAERGRGSVAPRTENLSSRPVSPPAMVTVREWEVAQFVAQGLTNADIAAALHLSATTVKTHLASLFAKLHVTNRVQLAIYILEHQQRQG